MPNFTRFSLLVMGLFGIFAGTALAETTIRCPLPQANRTITDRLPRGWWTTPVVNRLSGTRVQQIGGRPALMCLYGNAGSIQRKPPEGQTCAATRGGFRCVSRARSSRPRPGPGAVSAGTITVRQTHMFDLDRGREERRGADFWFEAEAPGRLYLKPQNNARIAVGNRSARGLAGCSRARFSRNRVPLRDLPAGAFVCAKTSEGRISEFRVLALSSGSPKTLRLRFTTWRKY